MKSQLSPKAQIWLLPISLISTWMLTHASKGKGEGLLVFIIMLERLALLIVQLLKKITTFASDFIWPDYKDWEFNSIHGVLPKKEKKIKKKKKKITLYMGSPCFKLLMIWTFDLMGLFWVDNPPKINTGEESNHSSVGLLELSLSYSYISWYPLSIGVHHMKNSGFTKVCPVFEILCLLSKIYFFRKLNSLHKIM